MILPGNEINTLPKIVFEEIKGTISIVGRSVSLEAEQYFDEFLPYLEDCLQKAPLDIKVILDIEFFNTKTSRKLLQFFQIIKTNLVDKGFDAKITWVIEKDDNDMKEAAEDYASITKLKFEYLEK